MMLKYPNDSQTEYNEQDTCSIGLRLVSDQIRVHMDTDKRLWQKQTQSCLCGLPHYSDAHDSWAGIP